MAYIDALNANAAFVEKLGEGNAHLVWTLAMYLEEPDFEALASEALTDGPDDKKIDFIYLDRDAKRIVFAQGYYGAKKADQAPANKASDLNTAAAWILSGDLDSVPEQLRTVISECRNAITESEIEVVELLYVHNYPESVNVTKELQTAAEHVRKAMNDSVAVTVIARELGTSMIEHLFATQDSHIEVKDQISCPAKIAFTEKGPTWKAYVASVPGEWLHGLYATYGDKLFSANYRGFLGITRRRRINTGIRQSAETKPKDFWVFNNGITLLTLAHQSGKDDCELTGISIINGAQTTGSIGSVDIKRSDLKDVKVLCRMIECTDTQTINEIVKFNNTQNEITTWDQYSNDSEQNRIETEFFELGHVYNKKRGFQSKGDQIGIEEVAQPLLAFHGRYQDANRGKNQIFDRKPLYQNAFDGKKARHVLFVYSLARAIDERRIELKLKSTAKTIISMEEDQLALLRNLRFKHFLIAVTAQTIETIVGRKADSMTIAFSSDAAKVTNNTLIDLAARWAPIVEVILTFVASKLNLTEFVARASDDNLLSETAKHVSSMLYATKAADRHSQFARLTSAS
ncbi:AIPR family protein [Burkholderia glumae]|uniref:AIPR family protein n=1 Tax=Burkholderia glumae TaxID=337 RepID=UPI002150BED0|nr:AIPR family protein [Burkholderia glumae]